ncbi:hypothetical protein JOD43_001286 [Pullulanibacillus pueri]|uniref:DUF4129 domain-containing protein n=1 Tax=Pullulanibacillus pueri TaxID=1437324 RepID=A0A8J3EL49_9BACL|nr:DUF4129 domain-containing protein [Pullulanibacillus pueri]MBM7681119.1 hypothetical protein [Pullulanibacillus pueri]GGH77121.1 hypothetical protein GCM10007096_08550 [Pullulanibacillus pueri]
MSIRTQPIECLLTFTMDMLIVYIISAPLWFIYTQTWQSMVPVLVMTALTYGLFLATGYLISSPSLVIYLMLSLVVFGVGLILNVPMVLSFMMAMLLLWRVTHSLEGTSAKVLWDLLLMTSGFLFMYCIFITWTQPDFSSSWLFVVLFFVLALNVFSLHLIKSETLNKSLVLSYAWIFVGLGVFGAFIQGIGSSLYWAFLQLSDRVAYGIFYPLSLILSSLKGGKEGVSHTYKPHVVMPHHLKDHPYATSQYPSSISTLIGLIAVLLILVALLGGGIILYKKTKKQHVTQERMRKRTIYRPDAVAPHSQAYALSQSSESIEEVSSPKDTVRTQLVRLQKRLEKSAARRLTNETVSEWVERLPAGHEEKEIIRDVYEKVRYGAHAIHANELNRYKKAIETVISHFK